MSRKFHRNMRLKLRFKTWRASKLVIDTTRSSKGRFRGIMQDQRADLLHQCNLWQKSNKCRCRRNLQQWLFFNKKDLLNAYSIFTSKDEVNDYLENFEVERRKNEN